MDERNKPVIVYGQMATWPLGQREAEATVSNEYEKSNVGVGPTGKLGIITGRNNEEG
jgi:hypothetical protein